MKEYVKPEFFYENYELSHNVATCGYKYTGGVIKMDMGDEIIEVFGDGVSCQANYTAYFEYCYQTGTEGYGLFHS